MKKEMKVSGNEQQTTFELAQFGSIDADTAKTPWSSPKFRALKVSQETLAVSSGTPAPE